MAQYEDHPDQGKMFRKKNYYIKIQRTNKYKIFNRTMMKKKQKRSSLHFPVSITAAGFFVISQ